MDIAKLTHAFGLPPLVAQCLADRGFCDAEAIEKYLDPRLKGLGDPFLLHDMEAGVARLFQAKARQEKVLLLGDYDVDGVTSTALLTEVLSYFGWSVSHYLPQRLEEGYGLTRQAAEYCVAQFAPSLLVALDCGSTSSETISWLKARGIDVIVVDHHQVCSPCPPAVALINPQLSPGSHPCGRELCTVGLAFKLAHAIVKRAKSLGWSNAMEYDLRPLLDLVALGTVADLVPLTGENRILVRAGLDRLSKTERRGLQALKQVAGLEEEGTVDCQKVAFQLAPRLNAAGRLEDARQALDLLLTPDHSIAETLAQELELKNRRRQEIEKTILEQALSSIRERFRSTQDFVIVEGNAAWHVGVVGIVASRIAREFHRPAVILGSNESEWRGSGRSIEGFDLAAGMRQCADLLLRHGGHAMAAGVSILPERLAEFRSRLNDAARAVLRPEDLKRHLPLDAEVSLRDLNIGTLECFSRFEPFGQGNPPLQFSVRNVSIKGDLRRMGKELKHAKGQITDGRDAADVVWWNCGSSELPPGPLDLAVAPEINSYRGDRRVQLKLLDWAPATLHESPRN